jgi:ATP phosphoribosyltransferase
MTSNTESLCAAWLEAKHAENVARNLRVKIEADLAEAFDVPAEGSKTHRLDNYKLTLTQPVYRKVDETEWLRVASIIPENLRPVRVKLEADATGCKYLANNEPDMWRAIAGAFETKPGKIGVKVEAI